MNGHLQRAYTTLNKCLFDSKLKSVDFVLNPTEKHLLRLRLPNVVEIGCGFCETTYTAVLDELLHVMVHLENRRRRITDFTHNQYHKREFCERALEQGLIVVWHKTRGWGLTISDARSPVVSSSKVRFPQAAAVERREQGYAAVKWPLADFQKFQEQIRKEMPSRPQKVFQLKYVCRCDPPMIVRSGRRPDSPNPLDITCNVCKAKFVLDAAG